MKELSLSGISHKSEFNVVSISASALKSEIRNKCGLQQVAASFT